LKSIRRPFISRVVKKNLEKDKKKKLGEFQ